MANRFAGTGRSGGSTYTGVKSIGKRRGRFGRYRRWRRTYVPTSHVEHKCIQLYDADGRECDTTTAKVLLNGCTQGTTDITRVGRKIQMSSLLIRGAICNPSGTGLDQINRVMVIIDNHPNGAVFGIADLLDNSGAVGYWCANRNRGFIPRFTVLYDETYHIGAAGEANSCMPLFIYRKLNMPVNFNTGNAGTIADFDTGAIYLVTMGNLVAGNTAACLYFNSRVRFTDI